MGTFLLSGQIIGAISLGIVIGYDCARCLHASRLSLAFPYIVLSLLLLGGVCFAFSGKMGMIASALALMFGVALYHAILNSWGDLQ